MYDREELLKRIEALEIENNLLRKSNEEKDEKIRILIAKLAKRYAKASEVMKNKDLNVLNEAEIESGNGAYNDKEIEQSKENEDVTPKERVRKYTRTKATNAILTLPPDTPIVEVIVPSEAPICSECGTVKVESGTRTVDSIVKTVSYGIARRIYTTYTCPNCDKTTPEVVDSGNLLNGTICDPLLLADSINAKFNLGTPLYRQERAFRESGIKISRQLLSSWIMRSGMKLLDNLEPILEEELFKMPMINADETPMLVLGLENEDGAKKGPNSKLNAYMLGRIGIDEEGRPGLASFKFTDNRRDKTVCNFFDGYNGCLQSDGLSGYKFTERELGMTHLLCLVHARRKAMEAMGKRQEGIAFEMVKYYGGIFKEESKWNAKRGILDKETFIKERKAAMLPLFSDFKDYIIKEKDRVKEEGKTIAPKTKAAMNYYLNNYEGLIRFLDYYYATSSNQVAEEFMRKYVIDRNNFLFNITEDGADVSCLYFSLVMSCRNLGINPTDYLTHLFLNAGKIKNGDREGWRNILPGRCSLSDAVTLREAVSNARADDNRTEEYILRGKRL